MIPKGKAFDEMISHVLLKLLKVLLLFCNLLLELQELLLLTLLNGVVLVGLLTFLESIAIHSYPISIAGGNNQNENLFTSGH